MKVLNRIFGTVAAVAAEPVAKPIGHIITKDIPSTVPQLPDDYEAVAVRIGAGHLTQHVKAAKIADAEARRVSRFRAEVLTILSEMGLALYDEQEVADYLKTVYGKTPFGWRALRDQDNPISGHPTRQHRRNGTYVISDESNEYGSSWVRSWASTKEIIKLIGARDTALYSKPVPLPVLLTIETLAARVPEATFWISDEAQRLPALVDPFLMMLVDGQRYIVERWDEPNFQRRSK